MIDMSGRYSERSYWVYILANKPNGTIYVGVTNSLERRIWEHKTGAIPGFSRRYGLKFLVHIEEFADIIDAIAREKEIKGWLRKKKTALIRSGNPLWKDLAGDWYRLEMDSSLRSE
jgi:putative endonuclease